MPPKTTPTDSLADREAPAPAGAAPATSTALAIPTKAEMDKILGVRQIDFRAWATALLTSDTLEEEDTEEASLSILRAILTAETSEAVFAAMDLKSAEDLCGTEPGGSSNVLEISGAHPMASTFDEGPGSFAVFTARDLAEGADITFSCGARAVQAAVMTHMYQGWMPVKARLVRRSKPTRKGFYPLNLEAGV
jgi:hypothetical protein